MSDLKKKAQEVADAGRFGDSQLIHVAPEELRGLASLMPDGKLTVNPTTGLPEAFFFLPFLAGLGAAAAPAAAATTAGLTAAGTGALTGGLAAGAGAAGAGLAGLGAAAAPTAGAAGGLFGSTLAATAPTAASGLAATGAATGGAGALAAPAATAASALPTATGAAGAGAGAGASGVAGLSGAGQAGAAMAGPASFANPAGAAAAGLTGAFPAAPGAVATGAGKGGLGALFGGLDGGKLLQYGALASMMMPQGGGGGSGKDKGKKIDAKQYSRGEQAEAPNEGGDGGTTGEFNYFPRARYYAGGGLVTGYAEGGLASLNPQKSGGGDEELIDATMAALMGQAPNPDAIIQQFIQVFGPEALQDLIQKVQGGSGDGMSDSVPATVSGPGGSEPAALSEGEFVIPSDVVSGLGNGSTQAGAQQLQGMMDRTRQMRGGGPVQPPAINPRAAMPM